MVCSALDSRHEAEGGSGSGDEGASHLSFLSVLVKRKKEGVSVCVEVGGLLSYKLSVGGINVALLVKAGESGSQINAGGSDCLLPLFIHRDLRTLLKDKGAWRAAQCLRWDGGTVMG